MDAKVALINSQIACAYAEIEAMKAANEESKCNCGSPVYGEEDFRKIINKYKISRDDVIGYLW